MSTLHTTTTLSNQYVDIPELASAKEVAHKSFDFKDKAATQNGKAVQGMAYAIMVCWFNWHQDDKEGKLPSLVDCIHANKSDARKELKERLVAQLMDEDESELYKGEHVAAEKRSAYERERSNQMMLITRGLQMASILVASGITCGMFNKQAYAFAVKPSMLYEEEQIPLGRLLEETKPVLLDRRQFAVTNAKAGFVKITASVDQVNKAMRSRMKLRQNRNKKEGLKLEEVKPMQLATTCNINVLLEALHTALAIREKDIAKPIKPEMLTHAGWQMLTDIAHTNDELQERADVQAYKRNGITSDVVVMPAETSDAA